MFVRRAIVRTARRLRIMRPRTMSHVGLHPHTRTVGVRPFVMDNLIQNFIFIFFVFPLVVEGVLMESFVGVYLLNDFPIVFHALNIVALAMFGIFLVAIVGEMFFRR